MTIPDLSSIPNPYDFANPVEKQDLFVGREQELNEIRYYLDHAMKAPRPINLAILGPRASGKTSLLNMAQIEATKRGFCSVRIDLDEDDIEPLDFFFKMFDAIFSEACDCDFFGGKQGKTYDTYLDIVWGNVLPRTPEDKEFCPFVFPLQYARAKNSQNVNLQVSTNSFKEDLKMIRSITQKPFVLIIDEGNILAQNRVNLEKLRNVFMNSSGYMLIIAGTPKLFPVMNDVFSPIIRQFKKISVWGFQDIRETLKLIRTPLSSLGLNPDILLGYSEEQNASDNTSEMQATRSLNIVEIHDFTGGQPHEIQLICHFMFRRIQEKRAQTMQLNLAVLDEVRRQLETTEEISRRPVLSKIRALSSERLKSLSLLCSMNGQADLKTLWEIEFVADKDMIWSKSQLEQELEFFVDEGIISIQDETSIIQFTGDEFDKIYTKYHALEHDVAMQFPEFSISYIERRKILWKIGEIERLIPLRAATSPEIWEDTEIDEFLADFFSLAFPVSLHTELEDVVQHLSSEQIDGDIFDDDPVALSLYFLMAECQDRESIYLLEITLKTKSQNSKLLYFSKPVHDHEPLAAGMHEVRKLAKRAQKVGIKIEGKLIQLPVVPLDVMAEKVDLSSDHIIKSLIASYHLSRAYDIYIEEENVTEAALHVSFADRFDPDCEFSMMYNNRGYMLMAAGELEKPKTMFEAAIKLAQNPYEIALSNYNLGILLLKQGLYDEALAYIERCIHEIESCSEEDRSSACLFVPYLDNDQMNFQELRVDVDLLETALTAREATRKLQDRQQ